MVKGISLEISRVFIRNESSSLLDTDDLPIVRSFTAQHFLNSTAQPTFLSHPV